MAAKENEVSGFPTLFRHVIPDCSRVTYECLRNQNRRWKNPSGSTRVLPYSLHWLANLIELDIHTHGRRQIGAALKNIFIRRFSLYIWKGKFNQGIAIGKRGSYLLSVFSKSTFTSSAVELYCRNSSTCSRENLLTSVCLLCIWFGPHL